MKICQISPGKKILTTPQEFQHSRHDRDAQRNWQNFTHFSYEKQLATTTSDDLSKFCVTQTVTRKLCPTTNNNIDAVDPEHMEKRPRRHVVANFCFFFPFSRWKTAREAISRFFLLNGVFFVPPPPPSWHRKVVCAGQSFKINGRPRTGNTGARGAWTAVRLGQFCEERTDDDTLGDRFTGKNYKCKLVFSCTLCRALHRASTSKFVVGWRVGWFLRKLCFIQI